MEIMGAMIPIPRRIMLALPLFAGTPCTVQAEQEMPSDSSGMLPPREAKSQ